MDALRNFMRGRYGVDQCNIALMICGVLLSLLFRVLPLNLPFYLLTYVPFGIAIFRLLSRNVTKRASENVKFLNGWYRVKTQGKQLLETLKDKRNRKTAPSSAPPPPSYGRAPQQPPSQGQPSPAASSSSPYAFLKCPHCGQPIRLPKGRQLQVTCPACQQIFTQRT